MASRPTTAPTPARAGAALTGDLLAGFLVFLIALPLCLGIALASGFPPVAGVTTAVIGGILGRGLWSAPLTIKGPAAGLIVIAIGAVQALGDGDPLLGYRRALAVGVVAAGLQILFGALRFAKFCVIAPASVVHGMLAAIGVIIFAKQAHVLMGVTPTGKTPLELIVEIPWSLAHENPEVSVIGGVGLALLCVWPWLGRRSRVLRAIPAPIAVLAFAIPTAALLGFDRPHDYELFGARYHLGPEFLLTLPDSIGAAIVFPDFSVIATPESLQYVVMFALVGSLESVLSVLAVDALDPERRASDLDRDLLTVGVANLAAASVGGLPMISEIVRSKANIDAGARSSWANFFHGVFLLVLVAAAPALLHHIPLAALAAMLVFTGLRLASPSQLVEARHVGFDQVLLFAVTAAMTLLVDLLVGIAAGLALKVLLNALRQRSLVELFTTRVQVTRDGAEARLRVDGPASLFSLLRVLPALRVGNDAGVERVILDLESCSLVDHTFLTRVHGAAREWPRATLELAGHERLEPLTAHPLSTRREVPR